jgi:hypothetical protein
MISVPLHSSRILNDQKKRPQTKTRLFRNNNNNKRLLEVQRERAQRVQTEERLCAKSRRRTKRRLFYICKNDKNEDIFLKEATPARHQFFERSNASPCLLLVFLTRDKKEQKESFLIKTARVFSFFAFLFNSAKKSKKTFEDSFADHINHMRVK